MALELFMVIFGASCTARGGKVLHDPMGGVVGVLTFNKLEHVRWSYGPGCSSSLRLSWWRRTSGGAGFSKL
jgi:hypothetical protein